MLETLKKDVCEIAKRAQRDGLCKHKTGNFSARDLETGYVVITPTSVNRDLLTPEDMVVMDLEARVMESLSGLRPTSESLMHFMIYRQRPKAVAIAHTHSVYATAFSIINKPLPAVVYEAASLGLSKARVPVAPYGRPGTAGLADNVIESCLEADCFLLEKHGSVAVDERNIYEAFLKAAYIEELAQLYYLTLTLSRGKEPESFGPEELERWEYPQEISMKNL